MMSQLDRLMDFCGRIFGDIFEDRLRRIVLPLKLALKRVHESETIRSLVYMIFTWSWSLWLRRSHSVTESSALLLFQSILFRMLSSVLKKKLCSVYIAASTVFVKCSSLPAFLIASFQHNIGAFFPSAISFLPIFHHFSLAQMCFHLLFCVCALFWASEREYLQIYWQFVIIVIQPFEWMQSMNG